MNHTLLLNADALPISFIPISCITWQEAIKFVYVNAAEVLHTYEDWTVSSPSVTMLVPSVILLKEQVKVVRTWAPRETSGPQKHLVFLRDMYVCQYCNEQFPRSKLTIDHVLPKFYGGKTKWDNVVASCSTCNHKRGHDFNIRPRIAPFRPTYSDLIKNMRKFPISLPHVSWNYYLGWDEGKIRLINPKSNKTINDNFDFGIRLSLECIDI